MLFVSDDRKLRVPLIPTVATAMYKNNRLLELPVECNRLLELPVECCYTINEHTLNYYYISTVQEVNRAYGVVASKNIFGRKFIVPFLVWFWWICTN